MLDLTLDDSMRSTELYVKACEHGFDAIYCAHTGLHIGFLSADELHNYIDMQLALNPLLDDETFIDHLQLAMIPVSSRPSPIFQGMTAKQYALVAKRFPEQMFRFLAGRLVFERWTHMSGHVISGGKLEWLKSIQHQADAIEMRDLISSLIRIDAIFSLRKCFINHELKVKLESIRNEWPGFEEFANFVYELETANITRLGKHNNALDGYVSGNAIAQQAAIQTASGLSEKDLMDAYLTRKKAQALHDAAREQRAKENIRRIDAAYAKQLDNGKVKISRGADAVIGLAMAQAESQGAASTEFVLKALSQYDFTKSQTKTLKQLAAGNVVIEKSTKTRTPKVKKAPKIVFDLSAIPEIPLKIEI